MLVYYFLSVANVPRLIAILILFNFTSVELRSNNFNRIPLCWELSSASLVFPCVGNTTSLLLLF